MQASLGRRIDYWGSNGRCRKRRRGVGQGAGPCTGATYCSRSAQSIPPTPTRTPSSTPRRLAFVERDSATVLAIHALISDLRPQHYLVLSQHAPGSSGSMMHAPLRRQRCHAARTQPLDNCPVVKISRAMAHLSAAARSVTPICRIPGTMRPRMAAGWLCLSLDIHKRAVDVQDTATKSTPLAVMHEEL